MLSLLAASTLAFSGQPLLRTFSDAANSGQRPLIRSNSHRRASAPLALAPAELWSGYLQLLETAPLVTKACTAGVIIGSGDAAAQTFESSKTGASFDLTRALRWGVFGLVLQG